MELSPKYIIFWDKKTSGKKFKKIEITLCIISHLTRIKLDLNNKRNHRKYSNTCRLNNPLRNDQWVNEEIREETIIS
jgi:hypothetical protein